MLLVGVAAGDEATMLAAVAGVVAAVLLASLLPAPVVVAALGLSVDFSTDGVVVEGA